MSRLDPEEPDSEEASIKVSLLPMKLNIDQVRALKSYFGSDFYNSIFRMPC